VLAFVLSGLVFGFVGYQVGKPSKVDQLVQDDLTRELRQIVEVTDLAERTRDQLLPVVDGLATALPPAGGAGTPATADTVAGWQRVVDAAAAAFATPPSGSTDVNVTRGSLAAGLRGLQATLGTYALSRSATGDTATRLRELARGQRDNALATWGVGGTMIEKLNHGTGRGHHHVFLSTDPNSSEYATTTPGAPK
jgi:hypothetical protein